MLDIEITRRWRRQCSRISSSGLLHSVQIHGCILQTCVFGVRSGKMVPVGVGGPGERLCDPHGVQRQCGVSAIHEREHRARSVVIPHPADGLIRVQAIGDLEPALQRAALVASHQIVACSLHNASGASQNLAGRRRRVVADSIGMVARRICRVERRPIAEMPHQFVVAVPYTGGVLLAERRGIAVIDVDDGIGGRRDRRQADPRVHLTIGTVVTLQLVIQLGHSIRICEQDVSSVRSSHLPPVGDYLQIRVRNGEQDREVGQVSGHFRVIDGNGLPVGPCAVVPGRPRDANVINRHAH